MTPDQLKYKNDICIGDKYLLNEKLKVLCCSYDVEKDEIVTIFSRYSKNRVLIRKENNSVHKVKFSSLRRCGIKLNDRAANTIQNK